MRPAAFLPSAMSAPPGHDILSRQVCHAAMLASSGPHTIDRACAQAHTWLIALAHRP